MSIDESQQLSEAMQNYAARQAQEYADAEIFNNWMPPDGPHVAYISAYKEGESKKGAWQSLTLKCLDPDPELQDKEFAMWFREGAPQGILKAAVSVLAEEKVDVLSSGLKMLKQSVGMTINVTVATNEKGFKNVRIVDVIPAVPVTE